MKEDYEKDRLKEYQHIGRIRQDRSPRIVQQKSGGKKNGVWPRKRYAQRTSIYKQNARVCLQESHEIRKLEEKQTEDENEKIDLNIMNM